MGRRLIGSGALGFAIGFTTGCVVVASVAKWPAACKVDGMLIWTALASIGSICAAGGAVYAAHKAIDAARIPVQANDVSRHAQARVIAAAIESELMVAAAVAHDLAVMIPAAISGQRYSLLEHIPSMKVQQTAMLDRFLGNFDVFGVEDGAKIANAASAILNLNSLIDQVAEWKYDTVNAALFSQWETRRLNGLAGLAVIVGDSAREARAIVTKRT